MNHISNIYAPVSIILLNWNGLRDTLECIDSLLQLTYKNYKIIVVDNNSHEDLSILEEKFPQVLLVKNKTNLGYAGGNNVGISKASELGFKYCWILNNDTTVEPQSLEIMINVLENNAKLSAVTNLILYSEDTSLSWFAGGIIKNGIPSIKGYFEKTERIKTGDPTKIENTDYLSGCSFIAQTNELSRIGGFDENYFCYVEDIDISLKLMESGFHIAYIPNAVIYHKVSRATGNFSPVKFYYKHRNMIYFLRKFNNPKSQIIKWWGSSLYAAASLFIKRRKYKTSWYLLRGLYDALRGKMGQCHNL